MFLANHGQLARWLTFLCLRRGVSEVIDLSTDRSLLFSAYAEVFLQCRHCRGEAAAFLCLRRGVSQGAHHPGGRKSFSLPTQRCFFPALEQQCRSLLFSAYAEVFLNDRKTVLKEDAFLCLRRGVSDTRERRGLHLIFSLPTQRCFPREQPGRNARDLFSAYAEVFLPGIGKAIG